MIRKILILIVAGLLALPAWSQSDTTCIEPQGLALDQAWTDSARIVWQDADSTQWLLTVGSSAPVVVDTTVFVITGLSPDSAIHVELRALCPSGDTSAPAILDFRTACLPIGLTYFEDFDSYRDGDMPSCWSSVTFTSAFGNVTGTVEVRTTDDEESGWLVMYRGAAASAIALSPTLNSNGDALRISFRLNSMVAGLFAVGVLSGIDFSDTTSLLTGTTIAGDFDSEAGWTEYTFFTDAYPTIDHSHPLRVALVWANNANLYVDDFEVTSAGACHRPTAAWIDTAYADTVVVAWEDYSFSPVGYEVRYALQPSLDSAIGSVMVDSTWAAVGGLAPSLGYYFWVRALCPDDSNRWIYAGQGFTECGPLRLPHTETFSACNYNGLPYCWEHMVGNWYGSSGRLRADATSSLSPIVATPVISAPGNEIYVKFNSSHNGSSHLQAGYIAAGDSVFVPLLDVTENGDHEFYTDNLSADDTIRLAFRLLSPTYGSCSVSIDDLVILQQRCRHPESVHIDSVSFDMARVVVSSNVQASLYRFYLTHDGVTQTIDVADSIVDLTLLEPGTDYQLDVVILCNNGGTSLSVSTSFRTYCHDRGELDLPYFQDFDSLATGDLNPSIECWTFIHQGSTHTIPATDDPLASPGLLVNHLSASSRTYISFPPVDHVADLMLRFDAVSLANCVVTIEMGYMTVPIDDLTFQPIDTVTCTVNGLWRSFELPFGVHNDMGNFPAIRISTAGSGLVQLDNVWLGVVPDCSTVIDRFTVSNVWSYCADMSWNVNRAHNLNSEYVVRIIKDDGSDAGDFFTHDNAITACNLDQLTTYHTWVEFICGGELHAVSDTVTFTTRCDNAQSIEQSAYSHHITPNAYGMFPLHTAARYSASQQLFTAEEMDGLPMTVTAIDLRYLNDQLPLEVANCSIYLSHFSGMGLDEWLSDELYLVYSGPLHLEGDAWNTIYFTAPFEYNGLSSLVLTMVGELSQVVGGERFRTYNMQLPMSLRYNSDVVPFNDSLTVYSSYERSDIRFHICPGEIEVCPTPQLTSVVATASDITMQYDAGHHPCEMSISQGWIWNGNTEAVNTSGLYTFDSLDYATVYIVGARRICGNQRSNWATRRINTLPLYCPAASTPWDVQVGSTEAFLTTRSDSVGMHQLHVFNYRLDTIITQADTLFHLDGLTPNVTYRMSHRTLCGNENSLFSQWSDTTTFTTGYCHPLVSASVRAEGLTAARVSWVDNSSTRRYRVEYGLRGYTRNEALGSFDTSGNELLINGLEAGQMYDFYVAALCPDGSRSVWIYAGGVPPVSVAPVTGLLPRVAVYPNPASGSVTVDYDGQAPASLALFDIDGRLLLRRDHLAPRQELDLSGFPAGPYFVRVTSAEGTSVGKLVVR